MTMWTIDEDQKTLRRDGRHPTRETNKQSERVLRGAFPRPSVRTYICEEKHKRVISWQRDDETRLAHGFLLQPAAITLRASFPPVHQAALVSR